MVGDGVVVAMIVRAGFEGAGAVVFVVYGASLLGSGWLGVKAVVARVVRAGVEGAGVDVVSVEGAIVIEAGVVENGSRWSQGCWIMRSWSRCGGGWY